MNKHKQWTILHKVPTFEYGPRLNAPEFDDRRRKRALMMLIANGLYRDIRTRLLSQSRLTTPKLFIGHIVAL